MPAAPFHGLAGRNGWLNAAFQLRNADAAHDDDTRGDASLFYGI